MQRRVALGSQLSLCSFPAKASSQLWLLPSSPHGVQEAAVEASPSSGLPLLEKTCGSAEPSRARGNWWTTDCKMWGIPAKPDPRPVSVKGFERGQSPRPRC
jgi:hypothetical protein